MKLTELKQKDGTYAGVHFNKNTVSELLKFNKKNSIPNGLKANKFHTTLLYSKKYCPNYKPAGEYSPVMIGKFVKYVVFNTRPSGPEMTMTTTRCLAMIYECDALHDRHEFLMKEHGASYDFDTFIPHISLSYDIGDLNIKKLPKFKGEIEIIEEFGHNLDINWVSKNA